MKKFPPSALPLDVWQQIELIFRRHQLSCLPRGCVVDGVVSTFIETTKRGVEIVGTVWFLPDGCYDLHLCLVRPHFMGLASITKELIREVAILEAFLDQNTLKVTAGIVNVLDVCDQSVTSEGDLA